MTCFDCDDYDRKYLQAPAEQKKEILHLKSLHIQKADALDMYFENRVGKCRGKEKDISDTSEVSLALTTDASGGELFSWVPHLSAYSAAENQVK